MVFLLKKFFPYYILVPGKVQYLTVVPINSSTVNITWNYLVNSTGISEYKIIVQHRSGDVVKTDSVPVIRTQHLSYYIISDLGKVIVILLEKIASVNALTLNEKSNSFVFHVLILSIVCYFKHITVWSILVT